MDVTECVSLFVSVCLYAYLVRYMLTKGNVTVKGSSKEGTCVRSTMDTTQYEKMIYF